MDKEVPTQELVALQAKFSAIAAKHEEALGKLTSLQADKEAAESEKAAALSEAATHQQTARAHAIRYVDQASFLFPDSLCHRGLSLRGAYTGYGLPLNGA